MTLTNRIYLVIFTILESVGLLLLLNYAAALPYKRASKNRIGQLLLGGNKTSWLQCGFPELDVRD